MTMKYYVDTSGAYLGGFDGCSPPDGAVEVPTAPVDARDVWLDGAWSAEDRECDEALAAVESRFAAKVLALRERYDAIVLKDGDQQQAKIEGIQQEYADAVTARQAEFEALWGE